MPQRKYSKEQGKVTKVNPRVILPIAHNMYKEIASNGKQFRHWLDEMIAQHPESFPIEIKRGYTLHDILPVSTKLPNVQFSRIKLKTMNKDNKHQVLTICSSDVMPYMTGFSDEVEKALFLRRFVVPFLGLTYVFGCNDNYWYNMTAMKL